MANFLYRIAEQEDNQAIQSMLASHPLPGNISISFRRQPNYFYSSAVEGRENQTIICEDQAKMAGFFSRSISPVYFNGKVQNIGYLGSLRVDKDYHGQGVLAGGWEYLAQLDADAKVPLYVVSIIADNKRAISILTKSSTKLNRPNFLFYKKFVTDLLYLTSKQKIDKYKSVEIIKANPDLLTEMLACLKRNAERKQFYPYYEQLDFTKQNDYFRGFKLEDVYLAIKKDKVIGMLAKWDQSDFKQTIVEAYNGKMKIFKPLYNFSARFSHYAPLPNIGKRFNYFYISTIAIDNDDNSVFKLLINKIYNDNLEQGYSYLILGLTEDNPWLHLLKSFKQFKYISNLYLASYPKNDNIIKNIDQRPAYLEVARM